MKIKILIDWNENQQIDKGLIKGIKTFYPNTKTKAYQGFIISYHLNFYLLPSILEEKNNTIADEINVMGESLQKYLLRFNKNKIIRSAPSFRFSHILNHKFNRVNNSSNIILVALPISLKESIYILNKLNDIFYQIRKYKIILRFHPLLDSINVLNKITLKFNYKISKNPLIYDLINSFQLISNTSSICLESIVLGKPVLIISRKSKIIANPIPKFVLKRMYKIIFDGDEIINYTNKNYNLSEDNQLKNISYGKKVRDQILTPVNKKNVHQLLFK